eukprot:172127_1
MIIQSNWSLSIRKRQSNQKRFMPSISNAFKGARCVYWVIKANKCDVNQHRLNPYDVTQEGAIRSYRLQQERNMHYVCYSFGHCEEYQTDHTHQQSSSTVIIQPKAINSKYFQGILFNTLVTWDKFSFVLTAKMDKKNVHKGSMKRVPHKIEKQRVRMQVITHIMSSV